MRKGLTALVLAASIFAASVTTSTKAEARCGGCWVGAGIAAGLIGGAIIARSAYGYGYYGGYAPVYYGYAYPAPVYYYGGYYPRYYGYRRVYRAPRYYGYRRVYRARHYYYAPRRYVRYRHYHRYHGPRRTYVRYYYGR
jgi:hypothetical protein